MPKSHTSAARGFRMASHTSVAKGSHMLPQSIHSHAAAPCQLELRGEHSLSPTSDREPWKGVEGGRQELERSVVTRTGKRQARSSRGALGLGTEPHCYTPAHAA